MATRKTPGTTPRATTRRPATKRAAKPAAPKAEAAEGAAEPAAEKPAAKPRATKAATAKAPAASKAAAPKAETAKAPAATRTRAAAKPPAAKPAAAKRKPATAKPAAAKPAASPTVAERIQAAPAPVKAVGIAGLVAAIGGAILGALSIFRRRPGEGTVPTDLMGTEHPDGSERAIDDFRPDPTAPVPASEREALRPAIAKPTLVAGQAEDLPR